jgi:signal transduction histidine kinase
MLTLDHVSHTRRQPLTANETEELIQLRQLVHHDLRTPLTSIMGFAELLIERDLPPEKQRLLLGHIAREAARIHRQLDQLG